MSQEDKIEPGQNFKDYYPYAAMWYNRFDIYYVKE